MKKHKIRVNIGGSDGYRPPLSKKARAPKSWCRIGSFSSMLGAFLFGIGHKSFSLAVIAAPANDNEKKHELALFHKALKATEEPIDSIRLLQRKLG